MKMSGNIINVHKLRKTGTQSILCRCKECKGNFYEHKSRILRGRGEFCSHECHYKWQSKSKKFANNVRNGVLKLYREDKTYRKRVSDATIKAMADPLVREKCRNAPKLSGKNNYFYGIHNFGKKHPRYKERKIEGGYIVIKDNEKDIFEHRKVIEVALNRKLTKKEVIHHLNLNKVDNSISNLILFESQSEHKKFHSHAYKFVVKNNLLDEYVKFFIHNGGKCVKITR